MISLLCKTTMSEILLPVTLDSANRKRDKSVSLRMTTNFEITNADFAKLDEQVQTIGWLRYRANDTPDDLPEEQAPSEGKSKLQRMRSVFFLIWRDKTDQSEPFNVWWDRRFEKILDQAKEKLD